MMEIVTVETGFVWTAGGGSTTVVDNLTTASATSALSANQGVVLKGLIDNIEQGGDAVTLDGQEGSYYLSRANHTGTQAPATIAQDASNRFVTDAEKTAWNGKQNNLGFTPVATDDSRLSDARTPTAHTHPISQVTNLQAELDNKADAAATASALNSKANLSDVYTKGEIDSAMDTKADAADLVPFTGAALPGDMSSYPDGKVFIID